MAQMLLDKGADMSEYELVDCGQYGISIREKLKENEYRYGEKLDEPKQETKWQKLKEWLEEKKSWNERQLKEAPINTEFYIRVSVQGITINKILDKMRELEYEDVEGLIEDRQKTIKFLQEQLAEKDKEIESIKQQLEETNAGYDFTYEQSTEAIKELKQNQTQLAIQELENAKMMTEWKFRSIVEVVDYLNNRIKELKGE